MSKTRQILSDISFYGSSLFLTQFVTIVAAILTRRFLGPMQVGVWSFVQVILNYAEYASLGTVGAVALEIPFYSGKGDNQQMETVKNTAFSFSFLMSLGVSLAVLGYAIIKRGALEAEFFYALLFAAGLVLLQRLNGFLITLLRAYKHFELAGKQMFYSAVVNALLIAVLSFRFRLYGFMVAMCLSFLFNIVYILRKRFFQIRFSMDYARLRSLIAYGLPLMIIGLLGTFFETIDRVMITRYMGFEPLGLYSIAIMTYTYINSVPNAIGIVIIPNIQEKFGKSEKKGDLSGYLHKAELALSTLLPVLIGLAWFSVPLLVRIVLPKFTEGIGSLRYLILGAYFLGIGQVYSQFIYVIRKHMMLLPLAAIACLLAVIFNWLAIRRGFGIQGVAAATVLAMFCNYSMLYFYASGHVYSIRERVAGYAATGGKFIFLVILLLLIQFGIRAEHSPVLTLLQMAVFLTAYAPFLIRLNREFGLTLMIKQKLAAQFGGRG